MIEKKYISNKKINIKIVLHKNSNKELFENIFDYISNWLNLSITYIEDFSNDKNIELTKIENEKIDFFFIDFQKKFEYIFAWNFYAKMHENNKNFKLILIKNTIEYDDIRYFKNGADDIIYINPDFYNDYSFEFLKWKFFSLLRRKWDYSKTVHTLIKNGVIIDLIKRHVIINNKEINITKKEFDVLGILVEEFNNKNNFLTKNKLFKKIYKVENKGNSRVIDQVIFRLKNKFPNDFFLIDKRKGIKIN